MIVKRELDLQPSIVQRGEGLPSFRDAYFGRSGAAFSDHCIGAMSEASASRSSGACLAQRAIWSFNLTVESWNTTAAARSHAGPSAPHLIPLTITSGQSRRDAFA